jgi:hypothetical protein
VQVVFASSDQSDCSNLTNLDREVDESVEPVEATFDLLEAGPNAVEQAEGANSFFSEATAGMVRSITLDNGLLTVDFDDFR